MAPKDNALQGAGSATAKPDQHEPDAPKKATLVKVGDKTVRIIEGTDLTGFRVGKKRLVAKKKRKRTNLKKLILEGLAKKRSESKLHAFTPILAAHTVHDALWYVPSWAAPVDTDEEVVRTLARDVILPQRDPTSDVWLLRSGRDFEVRHYVHTHLDPQLDGLVHNMLSELTKFQLRLRAENVMKYNKMKRYCIGFNEIRRATDRNKLKGLVVAPNLQSSENVLGGLDDVVISSVETCRAKDIPVIFALSRNRLGKAVGHDKTRLNVIGLLSVDGQHQEWKQICKLATELQTRWITDQLERNLPELESSSLHEEK